MGPVANDYSNSDMRWVNRPNMVCLDGFNKQPLLLKKICLFVTIGSLDWNWLMACHNTARQQWVFSIVAFLPNRQGDCGKSTLLCQCQGYVSDCNFLDQLGTFSRVSVVSKLVGQHGCLLLFGRHACSLTTVLRYQQRKVWTFKGILYESFWWRLMASFPKHDPLEIVCQDNELRCCHGI